MSAYLPDELLVEILKRLPAKSLLRFRSVCKFFNSTISSASFISDHIKIAKLNRIPVVRYFTAGETKQHYMLLPNMQELDFPFKVKSVRHFKMVGSSNGLLCLADAKCLQESFWGIILWNPSIKKYVSLPEPQVTFMSNRIDKILLGFGFDCKNDDYKVIRIAYIEDKGMMSPAVELYSVKSETWRNINAGAVLPYWKWNNTSPAFVEGCCNWVGFTNNYNQIRIVSFDMRNEEFKEVNLPDCFQPQPPPPTSSLYLTVLGEKLAGIQYYGRYDNYHHSAFKVWVMEDYGAVESWIKMYDVHISDQLLRFVGFTNNGKVLVEIPDGNLVLYDPHDTNATLVGVRCGVPHPFRSFQMQMYMESLVLLHAESATMQSEVITCGGDPGSTS